MPHRLSAMPTRLLPILLVLALAQPWAPSAFADAPVGFNQDVRPILSDRCYLCHGPSEQEAGLRLDKAQSATEWAIVPGEPDASEVIARVTSDDPAYRMPPPHANRKRLDRQEIETLRAWIAQGAEYEPHWAYIKPTRSEPPSVEKADWSRGAVDRFLLARMEEEGFAPSQEADRVTLVRRLYLDVIGLPPTADQVDEFLADDRPDAYERLVDKLLASPRYAERMATWWFDLIRFSDTVGYHADQDHRIAPYRDYVLKSFDENLPFDQFTIEQIAGDLLPKTGDRATDLWRTVATGYNRVLQTTHEGGAQDGEYRAIMMADRVRNVSEVWLGSSMGCAQCHDHKFDPFTQKDFYSLGAFFADVDHYGSFEPVSSNSVPTERPPEVMAWTLPVFEELQEVDEQIERTKRRLTGEIPLRYERLRERLVDLKKRRAELEGRFVPTMITDAVEPRTVRVLPRGDWMDNSGEIVTPQLPEVLRGPPEEDRRLTRLDLARWIVCEDNPLTARVVTNRLWKRFHGVGLSKLLIDVGAQGEPPSHPELLDWLAVEFIQSGWDLKHMVRLMVTSSAYRQSSALRPELAEVDPENRLVARQGRYRLEAEQIRDAALQTGGLLVNKLGGEFVKPYQPRGYYGSLNHPARGYDASSGDNQYRRGVYTHWQRQYLHPWLKAFDAPTREECTAGRDISNTPTAALVLLNDPSFLEAQRGLATRVLAEAEGDDRQRVRWAWREALSRAPASEEVDVLVGLLERRRDHFQTNPDAADAFTSVGQSRRPTDVDAVELAAWTSVSRAILNLSETITRN